MSFPSKVLVYDVRKIATNFKPHLSLFMSPMNIVTDELQSTYVNDPLAKKHPIFSLPQYSWPRA